VGIEIFGTLFIAGAVAAVLGAAVTVKRTR